jgi:ABC-type nitrate/sulfonate/bicarbonate transport system substrate-binding protein
MKKKIVVNVLGIFVIYSLIITGFNACKGNNLIESKLEKLDFIIDWEPGVDYIGYYLADDLKYFQEENIRVNFRHVNGAPLAAKLIGAGKAIIGTTTADQLMLAASENNKLLIKSAATIFNINPIVIVSLSNSPINNLSDLDGKRLGMNAGSVTFKQFELIAKKFKIKNVKYVDIGWGGVEQILQNQIDALLAYTMERPVSLEIQLKKTPGRTVLRLPFSKIDPDFNIIGQIIAVNEAALADIENNDLIHRAVRASLKGWKYALDKPIESLELFIKRYPTTDREYAKKSLEYTLKLLPTNIDKYYNSENDWKKLIRAMADMGLIKGNHLAEEYIIKTPF